MLNSRDFFEKKLTFKDDEKHYFYYTSIEDRTMAPEDPDEATIRSEVLLGMQRYETIPETKQVKLTYF